MEWEKSGLAGIFMQEKSSKPISRGEIMIFLTENLPCLSPSNLVSLSGWV
jgi:hypothetical protein